MCNIDLHNIQGGVIAGIRRVALGAILIWMSPEPGHVLPVVTIAKQLIASSHEVFFLSNGQVRHDLDAMGFATLPFFEDYRQPQIAGLNAPGPSAVAFYESLRHKYRSPNAYREAFRDQICAAAISVGAQLVIADGVFDLKLKLDIESALPDYVKVVLLFCHLPYEPITSRMLGRAVEMVYLAPMEFELPQLLVPTAHYGCPVLFEARNKHDFDWTSIDSAAPIVYCCFGSQTEQYTAMLSLYDEIVNAAQVITSCQFVINAGCLASHIALGPSRNVRVVGHLPQLEMIRRSDIVICHGGFGTVRDSIWNAVPMIIIPQRWDQPANARRIVHHRIGMTLAPREATAKNISRALADLMTNDEVHQRLAIMQQVFRDSERAGIISSLCEEWSTK